MGLDQEFLDYIKNLKRKYNFKIIDTHVHPLDVMGVAHFNDYSLNNSGKFWYTKILNKKEHDYFKPGLIEIIEFNKIANFLAKISFRFLPQAVIKEIKALYNSIGEKRAIEEMNIALVDEAVFLSLEPWVRADKIKKYFNHRKFLLLGSIDIHKVNAKDIKQILQEQIKNLGIIGIKLHPNLQNFKPQPKDNSKEIAEKLEIIYQTAQKHNLYLLFHGGTSNFTNYIDKKYERFRRSKNNALLENFCSKDGESEILGKYDIPIIIAHLGYFGLNKINENLVKKISQYKNVYFDTAAVSPKLIQKFIEIIGSKKIILGSDAFYNKMVWSIYFVYKAAKNVKSNEKMNDIMLNILSNNFYKKILCKK